MTPALSAEIYLNLFMLRYGDGMAYATSSPADLFFYLNLPAGKLDIFTENKVLPEHDFPL